MASLHVQLGQPELAMRAFDEGIERNPDNAIALMQRAVFLEEAGMLRDALRDIGAAISLTPANQRMYHTRAKICIKLKQYEQALADCNYWIKAEPDSGTHLRLRSAVYKAMGDAVASKDDYSRSQSLDPI